jgi:hypothetical protein
MLLRNKKEMDALFDRRRTMEAKFVEDRLSREASYQEEVCVNCRVCVTFFCCSCPVFFAAAAAVCVFVCLFVCVCVCVCVFVFVCQLMGISLCLGLDR